MTAIVEIHVTCPTLEVARELSHGLLDGRLAACCNIGKEVDSRYLWQGKKERHDEWPLTIKTRADLFDACCEAIRTHHPYETPAIVGFAVDHVDVATAEWIAEVTRA
ncbi:divalent-cation tolerance protein CutA [Aurantimonas sp. C2-6-R+9]|uniref:divalent-cation tolerance protein CutA n=1 Tax=unclassified Aurantimonas TaxID=2638230 RepID=UPI002E1753C0|nr:MULTISPECIES: divalent-cation tolerance protein CutA [unclassified Aurantimonas]MEC5292095.1 divalent-cation tolerance protein CutA [Aurantimonas sp. C2-3-R2]MEC5382224.1 divalent-cation tolerance protein CutA [Aurantimonas sp. C2-6-R+9]MEC5413181.1 divalent-cation tolerance protein CutA [Aurantimonas sp. C2-4-R8]